MGDKSRGWVLVRPRPQGTEGENYGYYVPRGNSTLREAKRLPLGAGRVFLLHLIWGPFKFLH